jgi:glycosyltransferase involved in cell wall biosynthesis
MPFARRRDLLFLGSTHPPNVDAVTYFVEQILPLVRDRLGDVSLLVVGDVCRDVRSLAGRPGVELVGHTDRLEEWLARARVFVAPLRYGAGVKGKILTAMSAGLPVVTTIMGAEGIGLVDGRSALIADGSEDLARRVAELYSDPVLWTALRSGARERIQEGHSQDAFRRAVSVLVETLLRRPRAGGARPRSWLETASGSGVSGR